MSAGLADPIIVPAGGGTPLNVLASTVYCKAVGSETGGTFSFFHVVEAPHAGPPLHIHTREDETFYVLSGKVRVQIGEEVKSAPPGTFASFPRGVPHAYKNMGDTPAELLVMVTPSGFERFFEALHEGSQKGPLEPPQLIEIGARFGLEFVGPPIADE